MVTHEEIKQKFAQLKQENRQLKEQLITLAESTLSYDKIKKMFYQYGNAQYFTEEEAREEFGDELVDNAKAAEPAEVHEGVNMAKVTEEKITKPSGQEADAEKLVELMENFDARLENIEAKLSESEDEEEQDEYEEELSDEDKMVEILEALEARVASLESKYETEESADGEEDEEKEEAIDSPETEDEDGKETPVDKHGHPEAHEDKQNRTADEDNITKEQSEDEEDDEEKSESAEEEHDEASDEEEDEEPVPPKMESNKESFSIYGGKQDTSFRSAVNEVFR